MKVDLKTEFICPECKKINNAEQINAFSYGNCLTREQRRHFVGIEKTINSKTKNKDKYYCCPDCEKWNKYYTFKIVQKGQDIETGLVLEDDLE